VQLVADRDREQCRQGGEAEHVQTRAREHDLQGWVVHHVARAGADGAEDVLGRQARRRARPAPHPHRDDDAGE
jgi:hypothetical protein